MTVSRLLRPIVLAGIAAAALAVPQLAAAQPPIHQTVPLSITFPDAGFCSFAVYEVVNAQIDKTIFSDGSQIWHVHRLSTFSANGKTLTSNADFTRFIDPAQPNLINDSGSIFNIQVPGYGAIFMQTGKLMQDLVTGQVYFAAGQNDFFTPDGTAALCAYLGA